MTSSSVRQWMMLPALVAAIALAACATERTPDARFGSQCRPAPGGRDGLCLISLYRLIARPELYHQRQVEITGYVVRTFDRYVIFPSRASYESNIPGEGIELQGTLDIDPGFEGDIIGGQDPVRVSGVFDARYEGPGPVRLGALSHVRVYNYRFIHG